MNNKFYLKALVVSLITLSACTTDGNETVTVVSAIENPAAAGSTESLTRQDFCQCVTANNVIDFACTRKLFDGAPRHIKSGFCVEIYCPRPNDDVWHANLCTID
jgi:hypothetical protein